MSISHEYAGIEVVVGGGDDADIANAIFNAFLSTKNLVSDPSDGNPARTINVSVQVYNSTFPVKFTRPKLSQLEITLTLTLKNITTTQSILQSYLENAFTNYINNLQLGTGELLNINVLNNLVFDTLETIPIYAQNVQSTSYSFLLDSVPITPTSGYLPIAFDQYLNLSSFTLVLILT